MSHFEPAERKKAKLRLGLTGPSGSGKTLSALKIASGLGGTIAMIDTENSSGELYAGQGIEFAHCNLEPPYTPARYIELIREAETSGFAVIIIDSLSHCWAGDGGVLDMKDAVSQSGRAQNSYVAWRTITPQHNALVEAMLRSPKHIIATMRSKTAYELVENDKGKKAPKKIGMAPVQREGMDYEFTVVFDLSHNHYADASKDRTSLFDGVPFIPTEETGRTLLDWLLAGKDSGPSQAEIDDIQGRELLEAAGTIEELGEAWKALTPAQRRKLGLVKDQLKTALTEAV